jgi:hypothetical protein
MYFRESGKGMLEYLSLNKRLLSGGFLTLGATRYFHGMCMGISHKRAITGIHTPSQVAGTGGQRGSPAPGVHHWNLQLEFVTQEQIGTYSYV